MELRRRVSFSGCSVFDARSIFVLGECLTVVSAVDSIGCVSSDWCAVWFRPLTVVAAVTDRRVTDLEQEPSLETRHDID
jgi:hypothetical protein